MEPIAHSPSPAPQLKTPFPGQPGMHNARPPASEIRRQLGWGLVAMNRPDASR